MLAIWFVELVLGILIFFLIGVGLEIAMRALRRKGLSGTLKGWRGHIEGICHKPLYIMLWIVGIGYVINITAASFQFPVILDYVNPVRNAALIGCIAWMIIRWKTVVHRDFLLSKKKIDLPTLEIIGRLLTILILVFAIFIILQMLGVDVLPLITFGGIGIAAIGFASKDVIANFLSGFMLHMLRSFIVGEQIIVPSLDLEGTVEEIGWYSTSVRNKDKRPVYLPNALFSTLLIINVSRMTHRRIEEKINISYNDFSKMNMILEKIRQLLINSPEIDSHFPVIVNWTSFQESSLTIYIDVYSLVTKWDHFLKAKQELLQKIYQILNEAGAEIPYPTTSIYLQNAPEK